MLLVVCLFGFLGVINYLSPKYSDTCTGNLPSGYGYADVTQIERGVVITPYTVNAYTGNKEYGAPQTQGGASSLQPAQSISALVSQHGFLQQEPVRLTQIYYGRVTAINGVTYDPALWFFSGAPTPTISYYNCMQQVS